MVQAQEWLDENYPKEKRSEITILGIRNKNLEDLKFPARSEQLASLHFMGNNFPEQDLSMFSKFTNLEFLEIGSCHNRISEGVPNRFYGSLEPLKDLKKLNWLIIEDTDIDSGLEYLPKSVEKFNCSVNRKKDAKCQVLYNLFANEQGIVETDDKRRSIKNFPQKLRAYKQKSQIKAQVGEIITATQEVTLEELTQQLRKDEELNNRKGNILSTINNLKSIKEKDKQIQLLQKQQSSLQTKEQKQISTEQSNQQKPALNHLLGKGGFGEDRKNIQKEIDILKNLRNEYVIQYYDTHSDEHEVLIIMEYAKNGTLTKFINDNEDKEHDWSFNTNLIKQIALGLAYIHHENIIHRDLKSMNILLANGHQAKISDFGLSRAKVIRQKYSEQSDIYALALEDILKTIENNEESSQTENISEIGTQRSEETIATEYSNSLVMNLNQLNLGENQQIEQQALQIQPAYGKPRSWLGSPSGSGTSGSGISDSGISGSCPGSMSGGKSGSNGGISGSPPLPAGGVQSSWLKSSLPGTFCHSIRVVPPLTSPGPPKSKPEEE
ncbi:4164_t:CDS:2 [Funneliformis geosporum]|uniref:4164_t:CDS:1 n=1 Tax=Funneliformis geosporum TaxID=1117311 RepID=A0A9W4WZQ6_9GLOM|nr:4164_t:CDS:2 [Funneliformis geosporum]